ncbi:MAG: DNA repair protein RecN, partial [Bacteroidales bacterium]|nr:DNA repair protein RecN [Bacteroidales bacterium]
MLKHLSIENYALIEKLNIDFSEGLSVITGETGAGKSILIGALSLILGKRADTQVLLNKSKKCIVEGSFNIKNYGLDNFFKKYELDYENITILRREINKNGKSRAFINDTPVNLNLLKEFGDKLVDIHSQHNIITLNDSNFQLAVIDNYINHNELINNYKSEYFKYINQKNKLKELIEKENQLKTDQDYFKFQFDELENTQLIEGEQESIENELEILNHSEEIKSNLFKASQLLNNDENNLINTLTEVNSLIHQLAGYLENLKEIDERLSVSLIDLKDVAAEIEKIESQINFDSAQIEKLNNRLDLIYHLQQKHRITNISELINLKESLYRKLQGITSLDENIRKLRSDLNEQEKTLKKLANKISQNRKKAIPEIEKNIITILSRLAMPDAQIKIIQSNLPDFNRDGIDKIKFLFNANKGGGLNELSKIASGGELSRLMLSVKSLISQRNLLPTIIFDEIDLGVSGDIAGKVGDILLKMSKLMQVVAITHLPQIAGKGNDHLLVYKQTDEDSTKSKIKKIKDQERIKEIAKMLSGDEITKAAIENAKELLATEIN